MKFHIIKHERDLKAGQYIRCVINCHGKHWIEYVHVCGKPYYEKGKHKYGKRVNVKHKLHQDYSYVGDLGVRVQRSKFPTVLMKFSNKAWNYLAGITDVREFAQVLTGQCISDKEYYSQLATWEWQKHSDDALHASMMKAMRDEYYTKYTQA